MNRILFVAGVWLPLLQRRQPGCRLVVGGADNIKAGGGRPQEGERIGLYDAQNFGKDFVAAKICWDIGRGQIWR